MKSVVVLAMHGAPPKDVPRLQVALSVGLHMWLEHAAGPFRRLIERYHDRLDARIRTWPRTAENAPFHAASQALATRLGQELGLEVIMGYNEFCAPSLDEALAAGDEGFRARSVARLEARKREGGTAMIVSHDPGPIRELCDRVLVLQDGRVAAEGPPDEMLAFHSDRSRSAREL